MLLQGLTSMTMKNSFKHKETKATRTKRGQSYNTQLTENKAKGTLERENTGRT